MVTGITDFILICMLSRHNKRWHKRPKIIIIKTRNFFIWSYACVTSSMLINLSYTVGIFCLLSINYYFPSISKQLCVKTNTLNEKAWESVSDFAFRYSINVKYVQCGTLAGYDTSGCWSNYWFEENKRRACLARTAAIHAAKHHHYFYSSIRAKSKVRYSIRIRIPIEHTCQTRVFTYENLVFITNESLHTKFSPRLFALADALLVHVFRICHMVPHGHWWNR